MMRLAVIGMLAVTGAITGYVTAQFLPHAWISRTTVAFTEPVSESRCAYAAAETLSAVALKPIVVQSAYYAQQLDYTPEEDIVEQIRRSASIACLRVSGKDAFHVEFRDEDKYLTLEMTRVLVQETGKNAKATMRIVEPVRTGMTGPGPRQCIVWGAGAGAMAGLLITAAYRISRRSLA